MNILTVVDGLKFLLRIVILNTVNKVKTLGKRIAILAASALIAGFCVLFWHKGEPRRAALKSISKLASNLANPNSSELLDNIVIPAAVSDRTPAEQREFIIKALADEISPEGVQALKQHAQFGSLKSVFPGDFSKWCDQVGANPDDCVAFKMERAGVLAEVVLVREGEIYRIVRCDNVKQMAGI